MENRTGMIFCAELYVTNQFLYELQSFGEIWITDQ